jgi:hypothetical protein
MQMQINCPVVGHLIPERRETKSLGVYGDSDAAAEQQGKMCTWYVGR